MSRPASSVEILYLFVEGLLTVAYRHNDRFLAVRSERNATAVKKPRGEKSWAVRQCMKVQNKIKA